MGVVRDTCSIVRLVPDYQATVLSLQLMLKLAEILEAKQRKEVQSSPLCDLAALSLPLTYLDCFPPVAPSYQKTSLRPLSRISQRIFMLCSSKSVNGETNCCKTPW